MKTKVLLFATLFAFGFLIVHAQTPTFEKGTKVVNLGVGFGGNYYSGYNSGLTRTPLLSASLDVGVLNGVLDKGSIGIGGYFAYKGYKWESGSYGFKQTNVVIGPRGTFHYPLVDKLDTYVGLMLAYNVVSWKETGNWPSGTFADSHASGIYFSGFIGARYYFSNSFGVMLELGSGNLGLGNIGIALKF